MTCISQYWIRECEVQCSEHFTVSFKYKGLKKNIEVQELVLFQGEYTRDVSAQEFKDCLGDQVLKLQAHIELDELEAFHILKVAGNEYFRAEQLRFSKMQDQREEERRQNLLDNRRRKLRRYNLEKYLERHKIVSNNQSLNEPDVMCDPRTTLSPSQKLRIARLFKHLPAKEISSTEVHDVESLEEKVSLPAKKVTFSDKVTIWPIEKIGTRKYGIKE